MQHSENYNMRLPDQADPYNVDDMNYNTLITDGKMKQIEVNTGNMISDARSKQVIKMLSASWPDNKQTVQDINILANSPGDISITQGASPEEFKAFNNAEFQAVGQKAGEVTLLVHGAVPTISIPILLEIRS